MAASAVNSDAGAGPRSVQVAALAGMTAAALFVVVFTVHGWLRPGYSARGMFVSELSLGPHGWIQILDFLVTGALVLVFGRGLAVHFRTGAASRAGPILVQIIGASLLASGPVTTDPSTVFDQASWHGIVHGIFGALVFSLAPVTCFVFYRRFRTAPAWRPLAGWTLSAGVVLTLGIGALKVSQQVGTELFEWKGLLQRVLLVTFMTWLFAFAARLRRQAGRDADGGGQGLLRSRPRGKRVP